MKWVCAGRSLGGHSTWIVLRNGTYYSDVYGRLVVGLKNMTDPRVKIGIPIIGRQLEGHLRVRTSRLTSRKFDRMS